MTSPQAGASARVLLLTGVPGVGKTTVIRRAVAALAGRRVAGFCTDEIRVHGERRGFRLKGFDGSERIITHAEFPGPARVSRYGVDIAAIDAAADALLDDAGAEVYVVDEIGKMECLSSRFVEAMRRVLDSGRPVIATVARSEDGFIAEVKRRRDVELWEVTHANRDRLPAQAAAWLMERLA